MVFSRLVTGVPLLLACAAIMTWSPLAGATASSCVKCHLDEDMIEDSLAQVTGKKSAMQSGAG